MSETIKIDEDLEVGPFTGAGPHSCPSNVYAGASVRFAVNVLVIIKDAATAEVYYAGKVSVVKPDASTLSLGTPETLYVKSGLPWSVMGMPDVSFAASIVADELVGEVTIPGGYTVEISYLVEGIYT